MKLKQILAIIVTLLVVGLGMLQELENDSPAVPTAPPGDTIEGEQAAVLNVIDGDTIDVRLNGERLRVRYIGVNTPERDEPCYADATNANAALVEGRTVTLVKDVSETDPYGRLLRYIYVNGVFVNEALVREGWAERVYYPPDTAYADHFQRLENEARAAGRGCHPSGVFE
ncbi:MAG: thermonuclease family protein [Anaerolineae bacterium]|nr:thermonuclease family protein [Anaerolineae bacterium]